MAYKILHLPTSTYIYTYDNIHISEYECEHHPSLYGTFYTTSFDDMNVFNRLIDLIRRSPTYISFSDACKNSCPEEYTMVTI